MSRTVSNRRTTINDVARAAEVSIKTVSRVLNEEPHVRPATREKVLAAAESLNYRPNPSARRLASNLNFVVGLVYDNPMGDYIANIQSGSLCACRDHHYNLLIHPCQWDAPEMFEDVLALNRQVDGLILLQPVSDLEALCDQLIEAEIPTVRVSQRPYEGMPWISVDDSQATSAMTDALIELGHRRIGFIKGHPDHGSSHDRLAGYRASLERHKIEVDESIVVQGYYHLQSGYEQACALLDRSDRPTAIFASNDEMAMGVLTAAHERGIRIPDELSVTGFDDSSLASHAWPPLTTIRQPTAELARLATETLMHMLQGKLEGDGNQRLSAKLIHRRTTGQPT